MKFYCFFEDAELKKEVEPLLEYLPSIFGIEVGEGIPATELIDSSVMWIDFPFPKDPFILYVFRGETRISLAAGGGVNFRAGVKVWPGENWWTIALRIWHELLHACGEPADDMKKIVWIDGFLPALAFILDRQKDRNYWQEQFYQYLTRCLIERF